MRKASLKGQCSASRTERRVLMITFHAEKRNATKACNELAEFVCGFS
jgi:hypothetical protein